MEANSSMIDVSAQFKSWIFAGFWITTLSPFFIVAGKLMEIVALENLGRPGRDPFSHPTYGKFFIIVAVLMPFQIIATLYLPIWGYFIRFDKEGELCSGDLYEGDEDDPKPYLW